MACTIKLQLCIPFYSMYASLGLISAGTSQCMPIELTIGVNYQEWLQCWKEHLANNIQKELLIPSAACQINTPLNALNWQHHLAKHPNQDLVLYFLDGISNGFRIGLTTPA